MAIELFEARTSPPVRGYLHRPAREPEGIAVLAHGAGSNANALLLVWVARALCEGGLLVLRCDLPYRQRRASGPPRPAEAAGDREGLLRAVEEMRRLSPGPVLLGGQSYGGRQASMLAADQPGTADCLLLLSYPLHPPGKPEQVRTAHLPRLRQPCLFVHGARDPFGSIEEMRDALRLVGRSELMMVEGAGHDLKGANASAIASRALALLR
jgi:predicted alpha/beta-hydrolase family hydrolase